MQGVTGAKEKNILGSVFNVFDCIKSAFYLEKPI
jgi:hypothetical protein